MASCPTVPRGAILLALVASLLLPGLATGSRLPHEKYRLDNGMTVILHEDHALPLAVVNVWYHVGAKDELVGRSGFAHLFEHLMFMGTERVPGSQFDEIMESGGGFNNASTNQDRTNYYSSGPAELLPTLLWLEADRLQDLGRLMDQEKLDKQRDVVRNERRQSYENRPYGKADLLVESEMFPAGHPYHDSVIGSHEDLQAATVADVRGFFDTFYVPSNASLVVAGDFDPAEIKPLIARLFGTLPKVAVPPHATAAPVRLPESRTVMLADQVQLSKIILTWHSPAAHQPGDAEMDLAAGVLAGGPASRLHRRLVREAQTCVDVVAYQASQALGSLFQLEATLADDADPQAVLAAIDEELARFNATGPTEDELARVRNGFEHGAIRRIEELLARADLLNAYEAAYGEPDSLERDLDRYRKATARGVKAVTARALASDRRLVVIVQPNDPRDERPELAAPRPFTFPTPATFQLANGLTVHHFERPELPLVALRLVARGGAALDPPGAAGTTALMLDMLDEGAGGRSADEFAQALEAIGATFDAAAGRESATLSLRSLTRTFPEALGLFASAVSAPTFDATEWERVRSQHVQRLEQDLENPTSVAGTLGNRLLFGEGHPFGWPVEGTPKTAAAVTQDGVRRAHAGLLRPERCVLLSAGALDPVTLEGQLNQAFATWTAQGEALPRQTLAAAPSGTGLRVLLHHRPGAVQTVVRYVMPAPAWPTEDRTGITLLNTLFGQSFTSRLNQNLRERNGYTYGAGSRFALLPSAGWAIATSQVRTDVTGASLREFQAEFARLRSGDVTDEEAAKAVATVRNRMVDSTAGLGGLLDQAEELVVNGAAFSAYDKDLATLGGYDAARLNALAPRRFVPDTGVLVLVGDREAILPQLDGLGLPQPMEVDAGGLPIATATH